MDYYISTKLSNIGFEDAEKLVIEKLKEQGFGIVTEMDLKNTFKNKLNVDFRPYKILGACNPHYAYQAISSIDKIGVMLPCNVCIQQNSETEIEVFAINPLIAMQPIDAPELEVFAKQVYDHLKIAIDSL